jgi:hypothetical protein
MWVGYIGEGDQWERGEMKREGRKALKTAPSRHNKAVSVRFL